MESDSDHGSFVSEHVKKVFKNNFTGAGTAGDIGYAKRAKVIPLNLATKDLFFSEKEFVHKFGIATEILCRLGFDANNKACTYLQSH
jgi:hypothetical protein